VGRHHLLAALLVLLSPARDLAQAQFSAPYDPDFAPAAKEDSRAPRREESSTEPAPSDEAAAEVPAVIPAQGPFLLIDRADPNKLLEPEAEDAVAPLEPTEVDFLDFERDLKPFEYTEERFRKVRQDVDEGREPGRVFDGELVTPLEEIALSTADAPRPPPPEVELPTYGTSLSVTGRKVISFQFSEKRFLGDQTKTGRPASTNLLEIEQQLQLRMQGKVGPKITINVDYDDTKLNKQDISVVYTGDPDEVVQNVSFGDIDLSLPATEFVSYNKQLFGIRADIKYKGLRASFIGSRTKGTTKVKQFFGNTQFVSVDIPDTSYARRQHYDLTFGNKARLPIQAGTERIFLAQQNAGQPNVNEINLTVSDLNVQTSSFTGNFLQMQAGIDYTIDYVNGILSFRNQLQGQWVVAVDFIDASNNALAVQTSSASTATGGNGQFKLVKTGGDIPLNNESSTGTLQVGWNRELKTIYNIGQTQIVRDNGRGNFILQLLNQQRTEVGSTLNPLQKYPDSIIVDFENGTFRLNQPISTNTTTTPGGPDPDIYAQTPISKFLFHIEYNFRFKTFFLEPNLVVQSEIVLLDGIKLNRNVDYFIDYEAGFITFFNEDRIRPGSEISISFEVAPFVGATNDTLLGTRVSYDFNQHFALGSTLLYQSGAKSQTVPNITDLARSLIVYEFDAQVKNVRIPFTKVVTSLAAELAQSRQNMNLNDLALIDNMEGIRQEDVASTLAQSWQIAGNPTRPAADPTRVAWLSEDVPVLQINPKAQASSQESQKVLNINYDFSVAGSTEEVSLVFPYSISGQDFSQKTVLEFTMLGDASGNEVNFHFGGINEDADGDGSYDTEDVNRDNILQAGEDIGFLYNPPASANSRRYVANNGIIDSEDLNRDGFLTPADFTGGDFGYVPDTNNPNNNQFRSLTDNGFHPTVDFGAGVWHNFQIPLNISTATANRWTNIKQLRVSIRRRAGGANAGTLKFARIAVVGNTWQRGASGDPGQGQGAVGSETLLVTPVNNVDNSTYTAIFNAGGEATQVFNDLYGSVANLQKQAGSKNLSEQALQLTWSNMPVTGGATGPFPTVHTKRLFSRAIDISQHRKLRYLVYGNADGGNNLTDFVFQVRAGNDTNFFQAEIPLNFSGWRLVSIEQHDANGDNIMDGWKADSPNVTIVSSGTPSLQQVAQIQAVVKRTANVGGANAGGAVFFNEIHVSDPVTRVGTAKKFEANFELPGWGTFGGKHRMVDRNFQTPTSVVSNQDNRLDSGYLNLTRLSFFPMTFNLQRTITNTPSVAQTGSLSNIVTQLQGGKVTTYTGSAQGNFTLGAYPRLSLSHNRARTEYEILTRTDDRKSYNGTMQYGVPLSSRFLPRTIDLSAGYQTYDVNFESLVSRRLPGNFNTRETTQSGTMRLSFIPWEGSGLNPSYSLTTVKEKRNDITSGVEKNLSYPKSLTQNVGLSSNFRLNRWLNPQVNYSIDLIENNLLSVSTFVVNASTFVYDVGDIKTVNRSANGSLSIPITIGEVFPRSRLFRSFNLISGYQMQDGDVWNNVDRSLNNQALLSIRQPLKANNPGAQRANLTLRDTFNSTQRWSPLEAYNIGGRMAAFKTLAISNNYVRSIQRSEVTGTKAKTFSTTFPDVVANLSQLELLMFTERWMSNTQLNLRYSAHKTENVGLSLNNDDNFGADLRSIIRRRFDTLISYNRRHSKNRDLRVAANTQEQDHEDATTQVTFDIRKFRFTPKIEYTHDLTTLGTGVKTQDLTVITPSMLIRADLALPRGLMLPGSRKALLFTNRIIWTSTLSLANRRSPVTQADNSRQFNLTTSGDYEIAKNLRMTLNGAASRLWHKYLKEEDFVSYQFGTTLTFQF
jgi:hypothetical protein